MSHLSQEDLDAVKGGYLEHKEYFLDALKVTDGLLPDMLVAPRSASGLLNKLDFHCTSHELFKLAKALENLADAKKDLEKREKQMKEAGLGDQL